MNIFILEDDPDRVKKFQRELIGHDLTVTDTAKEAIEILRNTKFDFLFLDHDLGGESFVPSSFEETGYTVAKEMINSKNFDTPTVVHSANPGGAANMCSVLKAGVMPISFPWLDIRGTLEANCPEEEE